MLEDIVRDPSDEQMKEALGLVAAIRTGHPLTR